MYSVLPEPHTEVTSAAFLSQSRHDSMLSLNMRQASKAVSREQASSGRDCSEAPFPASVVKQVEQRLPPADEYLLGSSLLL